MSFDLTISRVCALAGEPHRQSADTISRDEIEITFRKQAEKLNESPHYRSAWKALFAIARELDPSSKEIHDESFLDEDGLIDVLTVAEDELGKNEAPAPFVALFPSRRLSTEVGGIPWIVRARATVTACALQPSGGYTKLWWTFEGIPKDPDPDRRATDCQAAALIAMTKRMEAEAIPLLHKAYRDTLPARAARNGDFPLHEERIHVSMSDNDSREVGALIDALAVGKLQPTEIRSARTASLAPAKAAMIEFDHFVEQVTDLEAAPPNDAVKVADDAPGIRGIVFRHEDARRGPVLAGIARRLGARTGYSLLSRDLKRNAKAEPYLRAISAARPLSARLANKEARAIDRVGHATGAPAPV